jgi:hypothetical protein
VLKPGVAIQRQSASVSRVGSWDAMHQARTLGDPLTRVFFVTLGSSVLMACGGMAAPEAPLADYSRQLSTCDAGGQGGYVTGIIRDQAEGNPLGGAAVRVPATGPVACGTLANSQGRFRLGEIVAGKHVLLVQLIGYCHPGGTEVVVEMGHETEVEIQLLPVRIPMAHGPVPEEWVRCREEDPSWRERGERSRSQSQ